MNHESPLILFLLFKKKKSSYIVFIVVIEMRMCQLHANHVGFSSLRAKRMVGFLTEKWMSDNTYEISVLLEKPWKQVGFNMLSHTFLLTKHNFCGSPSKQSLIDDTFN